MVEQDHGPRGLARVKDFDRRFTFFPALAEERYMILDFLAGQITKLSNKIRVIQRGLDVTSSQEGTLKGKRRKQRKAKAIGRRTKTRSGAGPRNVLKGKPQDKLVKMMEVLGKKVTQYGGSASLALSVLHPYIMAAHNDKQRLLGSTQR